MRIMRMILKSDFGNVLCNITHLTSSHLTRDKLHGVICFELLHSESTVK